MDNAERKVKGIWIPIDIWEDKSLTWNEKILFLEIDSFTSKDKDCYISNDYISNLLGVCETTANKILSSLINKGYVIKTSFDGRRRYVKSALHFTTSQGCTLEQGCIALNSNIPNINTNTCTNKEKEDNKLSSKKNNQTWRDDFDLFVSEVHKAKDVLLQDKSFRLKQERYYPNLDYELSLHKMVEDYWSTEEAWKKRKRQKKNQEGIDMVATLKKGFSQSFNRVYKQTNRAAKQQPDLFSGYSPHKVSERANDYLRTLKVGVAFEKDGVTYLKDDTFIQEGKRYYRNKFGLLIEVPIGLVARPNEKWEYSKKTMVWVQDEQTITVDDYMF